MSYLVFAAGINQKKKYTMLELTRGLMIAAGGYPKRGDAGSSTISETLCVNNINSYRRGRLDELRDVCVIASVAKGVVAVVVVAAIAGALRE